MAAVFLWARCSCSVDIIGQACPFVPTPAERCQPVRWVIWPSGTLADMGVSQIKMPQLGESVTEGTVDKWLKHEGDFVKRDEPLVEVVTDKVNAEIPSPFEGKLVKIAVSEGETVRVGAVIAQIETGAAGTATPSAAGKEKGAAGVDSEAPPEPAGGT